jgi:hypothetical protein
MTEKSARTKIMGEMRPWMEKVRNFPGFSEWKRRSIGATLNYGDPFFDKLYEDEERRDFVFPPDMEKQHNAVMAYLSLETTQRALADTQYYFRRYPFSNLPISHDQHLRYTCEMYFSRIYEFSERLKRCLNVLNEVIAQRVDVGVLIKLYAKDFRAELKERNFIHHHSHFDDIAIDKIGLLNLIASEDKEKGVDRGWRSEQEAAYRAACKEWSERARRRSDRVGAYLEAVAQIMLDRCHFLKEPIQDGGSES